MPIKQWSDQIVVVDTGDDPQFTDELDSLTKRLKQGPPQDVVLDMRAMTYVDSANIAKLLAVRKAVIANKRRVFLTGISTHVGQILLVVGVDKMFDVADEP